MANNGLLGYPLRQPLPNTDYKIWSRAGFATAGYNGLINDLGTDKGRETFSNPDRSGRVWCRQSTLLSSAYPWQAVGQTSAEAHTQNGVGQWWIIKFSSMLVVPEVFGLLGRNNTGQHPRNFYIQGSNTFEWFGDGSGWDTLYTAVGEGTTINTWWTARLDNPLRKAYRFLRVYNYGQDSSGSNYLVIGDMEVWGDLVHGR